MSDEPNFFDQPVRHKLIAYDSTQKITASLGDDYTTVSCWTIIISKTIIR